MIARHPTKTGRTFRVTFRIPSESVVDAERVVVVGDFNDWDPASHPLVERRNGTWSVTLSIPAGRSYRFRYLVDGERWLTDPEADRHLPNRFGSFDGALDL